MKTKALLFILCLVCPLFSLAQRSVTVEEQNVAFKHGIHPGLVLTIPEVSLQTVQDSWIKLLEKGTNSKVQIEEDEMSIFGAIIREISETSVNVYSKLKDYDTAVHLLVSYELKKDEFITQNSAGEEFNKARTYLVNFAKEQYLSLAEDQLKEEEKKLKGIEKALKKMKCQTKKHDKTIRKANKSLQKLNDEVATAGTSLSSLNTELALQKSQYETMTEGAAKDEKQKFIASMEKRINKLSRDTEKNEEEIADLKAEVEEVQNKSADIIKEQEELKEKLQKQKDIVASFNEKVRNIKAM
ncbi:MAG: hypothetical protein JXK95_12090 [Bacteroidales bacterium]|nr:hypothetical protein [Bacteroidales bacterium]